MLLDSTVAAVYDRRWSTKGRLVLDIHKCSAGVSPDMVSGGGRLPRAHKHTPRGVMQKKCGLSERNCFALRGLLLFSVVNHAGEWKDYSSTTLSFRFCCKIDKPWRRVCME